MKSPNNAGQPAAEGMEGSGLAKGNLRQQNAPRTPSRDGAPSALERVRQAARRDKKLRFTALLHHVYDIEPTAGGVPRSEARKPRRAWMARRGGTTARHWRTTSATSSERLKRGAYRAKPVRRVYISKEDGRQRPLGVPALEDKIVQRATVEVLNAIYEPDFLGFSYGFRPGRSQHNALDALYTGLLTKKVNWVLDIDIRGFFDAIDHGWLVQFVEHRIADRRVVRLIQKWLNAGVLEEGKRTRVEEGTPQGGSASPLLANVYLHYVFDLWVQAWRQKHATATSSSCALPMTSWWDSRSSRMPNGSGRNSPSGFGSFTWNCIPRKRGCWNSAPTRPSNRQRRGDSGNRRRSTSSASRTSAGRRGAMDASRCVRQTIRKRLQAKLSAVKAELRRRMHDPIPAVGTWLRSVVGGHIRYYGVPTNSQALHIVSVPGGSPLASRAVATKPERPRRSGTGCGGSSTAGCLLPACVIPIPCGGLASSPEARAGCGKSARPDLWRG